jgi:hypothetical protein
MIFCGIATDYSTKESQMATKRTNAAAKKIDPPVIPKSKQLNAKLKEGQSQDRFMAEIGLSAVTANTTTAMEFSKGTFGELDLTESLAVMREKTERVQRGDMSEVEATLTAQAATLDAMFNELARRAALNIGEYIHSAEIYLRQAFKAQAQCRSTLEALAEIKNPRQVAFVKQANISQGHQQINNGVESGDSLAHGKNPIQTNELSEVGNELLPDTRASRLASRVNQGVETVGAIDRREDAGRESRECR